ncbi:hypothetical protein Hanom_Chr09g00761661 [Helianthus anomalus]
MFIHLTKRTKFPVHVRLSDKRTNTNEFPAKRFTNCSLNVWFICSRYPTTKCPPKDYESTSTRLYFSRSDFLGKIPIESFTGTKYFKIILYQQTLHKLSSQNKYKSDKQNNHRK